jgi:alkyl hydroperoxide reductase subunit F
MTYTAHIENYLGFPGIAGHELVERFQFHMEVYPLSELVGFKVAAVLQEAGGFRLEIGDERAFHARTVVYCAGKEYRRLGLPGEERFLGNGIAFCATCDAPLYNGRKAAVVGGGNSALTAVRDLLSYATEVHLIHRREVFTADAALLEEVREHPQVCIHAPYRVRAYLGEDRLQGIEIEPAGGGPAEELAVDGVFLEIGLAPNTGPVHDLLALNDKGEIPIRADHATALAGFFAAGDVTDVPEKQISIAVGAGALAALSAYRYLVEKRLFTPKTRVDEDWT